jgi:hypothetical protein
MIIILVEPYKNFKQKISLTKKYMNQYKVEDLGGILYLEKKGVVSVDR